MLFLIGCFVYLLYREESVDAHPPSPALPNPFGSGVEEQVFFLFGLYDYDRSGFLDGLEMMKLLSDYNSHHIPGAQARGKAIKRYR
uniref:EF-hand domain-containing protein n=1 Tax=Amphilophus citrinellus TaxID=61819 RepID=A0A3Q0REK1_AMPCI